MAAALKALAEAEGPGYAIIGEMLELGELSRSYHLDLVPLTAGLAGVYCVGSGARVLFDALPARQQLGFADSVDDIDLSGLVQKMGQPGRVLVKGSNRVFWQLGFCATLATALEG